MRNLCLWMSAKRGDYWLLFCSWLVVFLSVSMFSCVVALKVLKGQWWEKHIWCPFRNLCITWHYIQKWFRSPHFFCRFNADILKWYNYCFVPSTTYNDHNRFSVCFSHVIQWSLHFWPLCSSPPPFLIFLFKVLLSVRLSFLTFQYKHALEEQVEKLPSSPALSLSPRAI